MAEAENTTAPNWLELPRDITTNILQRLDTIEIVTIACHICCYAIERSCGHLEDIDIQFFGFNDVLQCIAMNANNLPCMRLVYCWRISDEGISAAVRNLPLLEEVDISLNMLNEDSLEALGRCCPRLKSVTFARMLCEHFGYGSENIVAFVIAETMPGLRHLNIEANKLTNNGLVAILDACPLLESLEIEACFNLNLTGRLGRRCHKQIKFLRLPIQYSEYSFDSDDDNISYGDSLTDEDIYYPYDSDSEFEVVIDDDDDDDHDDDE
ncbi:hypothetical protein TSUD_122890 [Trifolium subterraneum]|uniref:F-box domain-containing protein n=1 Tax=Trifolium subterraneum TaxID=3900 RepID=A0A2Z6LSQ9_TRISU|nr:hypothetical protein TSUD_122890 [Trifolium subterraneum]